MRLKKVLSILIIAAMITTSVPGPQYRSYAEENPNIIPIVLEENLSGESEGLFESSNSTTEALVTITPNLDDILSGNKKYTDLSDEEKLFLCSTFNLTDQDLSNPLILDFDLKLALKVTSIAKISHIELRSVIQFSQFITEDRKLNEQMLLLGRYQTEFTLLSQDIDVIALLSQRGYELYAATVAVAASKVLNLPVETIIKDEFIFDGNAGLEENEQIIDNENDQYLLNQFHLDAIKIKSIDSYTEMTNLEILKLIEDALYRQGSNLTDANGQTTTQGINATTDSNQNQTLPGFTKEVTAPFAYNQNQNQVSPSNGSVVSTITPYTLPGRNGLDVTLSPTYSSANAGVYAEDYQSWYSEEYGHTEHFVHSTEYSAYYSNSGNLLAVKSNKMFTTFFSTEAKAIEYLKNWSGVEVLERYAAYSLVRERTGVHEYRIFYETTLQNANVTNQQTHTSKYNNLGLGWSWGIPSIETDANTRYLHLGDGQVYQISPNIVNGTVNLMNYPHQDLKFFEGSKYKQTRTGIESTSSVITNEGISYHFSPSGTLLAIEDRYGNLIDYFYEFENGKFVLKTIVDSVGRVISFNESFTTSGKDIIVTLPDERKLTYKLTKFENLENRFILSEFIDPLGNSTKYQYLTGSINFSYFSTTDLNGVNTYALLSNVLYHTGGQEQFSYELSNQFLGSLGLKQQHRATSHHIFDTESIKSTQNYYYTSNTITGYPSYQTELPENYTFETSIIDESTKKVITFNKFGLNINECVFTLDYKLLRENRTTYGTNKLPSKREYDSFNPLNGLKSSHSETMTYDIYGNLTTFIDGLGNKTEYSYYEKYNLPKKLYSMMVQIS